VFLSLARCDSCAGSGACGTLSDSTICTSRISCRSRGICDRPSQERLCGGTAASCGASIFLVSERNMRTRERRASKDSSCRLPVWTSTPDVNVRSSICPTQWSRPSLF
jgi:hypothetical protein